MTRSDIDILSTSAVHQGVTHVDFSLKLQIPGLSVASSAYSSRLDVPMTGVTRSKSGSRATSVSTDSIDLAAEAAADLEAELA
jgi:hypothetical protein